MFPFLFMCPDPKQSEQTVLFELKKKTKTLSKSWRFRVNLYCFKKSELEINKITFLFALLRFVKIILDSDN